eukprot:TRINITY_DN92464_c0_g1_i1.p1 TRINITY_DN92464_c0_g1~~TRINITY_DN92464_c0_g1_i1.p1  ORF type:complete len:421 (-),score=59.66 TRINITY_DN92464_c0_g1_i1:72-1178(-)
MAGNRTGLTRSKVVSASTALLLAAMGTASLGFVSSFSVSAPRSRPPHGYQGRDAGLKPGRSWVNGQPTAYFGVSLGCIIGIVSMQRKCYRTCRRAQDSTQPSLIQVLEEKKLLSLAENLGLLSKAEGAGLTIQAVERSGLLLLAEKEKLLTKAEGILTDRSTPIKLLIPATVLLFLFFSDTSGELASWLTGDEVDAELGFTEQVLAVVFGLPGLVLYIAGFAIAALFGGVKRTRNLTSDEVEFNVAKGGFAPTAEYTLPKIAEKNKLLSFAQNTGALGLIGKAVANPLTFAEENKILSLLESNKVLSAVESQSVKGYKDVGFLGVTLLTLALFVILIPDYGLTLALLLGLPGIILLVVGTALQVFLAA